MHESELLFDTLSQRFFSVIFFCFMVFSQHDNMKTQSYYAVTVSSGPDDCYEGDGQSYRGKVSETENGDECLDWNSEFILDKGVFPSVAFASTEGLGPHNFCRLQTCRD